MGRLTVFIVNYNGLSGLGKLFIESLKSFVNAARSARGVEVWLVDNASSDESVKAARELFGSDLNYLVLGRNVGYGAACNLAYYFTSRRGLVYDYYACSNNDIIVYPDSLYKLLEWLDMLGKMFPNGFIVAPILVSGYDKKLDFGGYYVDPSGGTWPLRLVVSSAKKLAEVIGDRPLPVSYADGAFIVFHKTVAAQGMFDPRYFLYSEDVEVCLRSWSNGVPSLLLPVVLGEHYRSASTGRFKSFQVYVQVRNRVYTAYRYHGVHGLLHAITWYLTYSFRLLDAGTPEVREILSGMGSVSLLGGPKSVVKFLEWVVRGFWDALRWAWRDGPELATRLPLVRVPLKSMVSMKSLLRSMQVNLKNILIQHATTHKAFSLAHRAHETS